MEIYPSLISSNLLTLGETIKKLEPHCDGLHIDVMDDHFVPNLTWGPSFVSAINLATSLPLHVHLMVQEPQVWVERLSLRRGDIFIFHIEAAPLVQSKKIIESVKEKGWGVGLALNPSSTLEEVKDLLPAVDHILLMTVNPGFSGQSFMPEVLPKIEELISIRKDMGLSFSVGVDGGVDLDNIGRLSNLGVDCVGVASAIFSSDDFLSSLKSLYNIARSNYFFETYFFCYCGKTW
jgi:ribulose-phosphate 3-epimerase